MKPSRQKPACQAQGLGAEAAWSLAPAVVGMAAAASWLYWPQHALWAAPVVLISFSTVLGAAWLRVSGVGRAGQSPSPRPAETLADAFGPQGVARHPTTGLFVREHLFEVMAADIAADGAPRLLGVIRFTDFDRMASFDRSAAGRALRSFGRRLQASIKADHFIAQVDRDCFCVWYRGGMDLDTASREFRALVYLASQEINGAEAILTPTIEAGVASYPADGDEASQILTRGVAALSRPEVSDGGELRLVEPPSIEAAREQFKLEQDLAQAIIEEQLTMCFQPVVDLAARRLIGAEALLRWDHPSLGPISPARFIPIVESIGLSDRFGLWVLNAACREAKAWQDQGLDELKVAVNLSAKQLVDPDLREKIERTLARHAIRSGGLELELTETAAMADAGRTLRLFGALRAMGVSLAIDDFGSGYSSLSYLKTLPFDKLKIDREFVTDVHLRRDSQAICKALIELGRGLDLLVLAEGVETRAEVETLRSLGCTIFQGYFFSRPLTGPAFREFATSSDWLSRLGRTPTRSSPRLARRVPA